MFRLLVSGKIAENCRLDLAASALEDAILSKENGSSEVQCPSRYNRTGADQPRRFSTPGGLTRSVTVKARVTGTVLGSVSGRRARLKVSSE